MKKSLLTLLVVAMAVAGLGLHSPDAEAKRLGGGKSFGMSRNTTTTPQQAVPPKPAAPTQQASPAPTPSPMPAPQPAKRSWLGPLAGLAAGIGLAALLSHFGMGESVANILMIALLAMAAFFVIRLLFRKNAPQSGLQYACAGSPAPEPVHFDGQNLGAGDTAPIAATIPGIPPGFDSEGFLRQAKLNFVRLQAANDRGDLEDIKNFTSPEVFAEIQMQYTERDRAAQRTDVLQIDATLLEVATEGGRHVASVRFHGMLREEADAAPTNFDEIWHLTKPTDGGGGWLVAGIQQVS